VAVTSGTYIYAPNAHYGKNDDCRAFQSLLCAYFRAHGKERLCRAHFPRRTVKKMSGKKIVCRAFLFWRTANK
jgi:hypothetical protein